jgi:hypothetical protein
MSDLSCSKAWDQGGATGERLRVQKVYSLFAFAIVESPIYSEEWLCPAWRMALN